MNNLFNVSGKTALVTGSSRGLGFTLAKGLAEAGCTVILNGTAEKTLIEAVEKLKSNGYKANGYKFDVRNEEEIVNNINKIKNEIGKIDILVNNAGIQIRGALEDFNLSDWQRLIDVNLTGAFLVSKAVVKDMIEKKSGKIINICSIQSELARPSIAPYTASKGGLKNLTKGMATDWGKYNIQINGIAPGYFKTELTKALYNDEKFDTWLCNRTPANRWGDPEELIGSLIFLASDASSYVNGHLIYVDGGMLACV
ncbi:5-keto-D-gluconate 5-reductase [hydrothermal vent metagenome]|uniref:5-keto-D-gluconate 5-reductase n=1 Tax=hydrothermal vent metagenome TaxID=652676 RepID=A0A3B1C8Q4_9ZZZZ